MYGSQSTPPVVIDLCTGDLKKKSTAQFRYKTQTISRRTVKQKPKDSSFINLNFYTLLGFKMSTFRSTTELKPLSEICDGTLQHLGGDGGDCVFHCSQTSKRRC